MDAGLILFRYAVKTESQECLTRFTLVNEVLWAGEKMIPVLHRDHRLSKKSI